jgi:peptidoglycan/LPS O-acetylase OafA/YrhL
MMAIVVALLGAFYCGTTVALAPDDMLRGILFGGAFMACGLALVVMIPRSERQPKLAPAVLAVGVLTLFLGVGAAILSWRDPFSWMMAILGLTICIDTICLAVQLKIKN